jgi:tetratricopeptide (TPR) repeat protein
MPRIFIRVFVSIVLLCPLSGTAQSTTVDSVRTVLSKEKMHDTTRLMLINEILAQGSPGDSLSVHYNKMVAQIIARNLYKKNLNKKERETFLQYLAYWYCDKAVENASGKDRDKAIGYYDKAIAIFRQLDSREELWVTLSNKGNILRKAGRYKEAVTCYFEALKPQEAAGDKAGEGSTSTGIAGVYEDQQNYIMALKWYKKAIAAFEALKTPDEQQKYELAIILHNTGFIYTQLRKDNMARVYFERSLAIDRQNGFNNQAAFNLEKIGNLYIAMGKYEAALPFLNEGLALAQTERATATLLERLGELYHKKGNWRKAEEYWLKTLEIGRQIDDRDIMEYCYFWLYKTYKSLNNLPRALEMYEKYNAMHNEVNKEAAKTALAEQQLKYDYEKREILAKAAAEKKLARTRLSAQKATARRNLFIYVLLFVTLMLGGALWLFIYYFRQKAVRNEHRNEELKRKLLLSQMNPHFIFNSVDNIQSLIYAGKDNEAISYLTKFSKLTRQILEHSRENYILLSEEIEMLENYLNIQHLLYNASFGFVIETDKTIDPEMLLVPPMLTQPFVENAIKHGLKGKQQGGYIRVRYTMVDGKLQFEVSDNGAGLSDSNPKHKSLSTLITRERLESIAPQSDSSIKTTEIVADSTILGVKTSFDIPYIYNN